MALTAVTCPDCNGLAVVQFDSDGWELCRRCWGAGEVERQYGPQDANDEVSHRPRVGSDWAIFTRWEQDRER